MAASPLDIDIVASRVAAFARPGLVLRLVVLSRQVHLGSISEQAAVARHTLFPARGGAERRANQQLVTHWLWRPGAWPSHEDEEVVRRNHNARLYRQLFQWELSLVASIEWDLIAPAVEDR